MIPGMSGQDAIVEALTSVDGQKRWELVRRADGFFVHSEESLFREDLSEFDAGWIEEYWTPTHSSGLFDTAEGAKADAVAQLPWLKETAASK